MIQCSISNISLVQNFVPYCRYYAGTAHKDQGLITS